LVGENVNKKSAFVLIGLLLVAATAPAATVNFVLDLTGPDGSFNVYASSSLGDNGGLACYGVGLSGPLIELDQVSPASCWAENSAGQTGTAGFTLLRTALLRGCLFAAQDTLSPTPHLLFGMGQEAGSFDSLGLSTLGATSSASWGSEMLIATGMYAGDSSLLGIDLNSSDTVANVFTSRGDWRNETASITAEVRRRDSLTGAIVSTGPISRPPPQLTVAPVKPVFEEPAPTAPVAPVVNPLPAPGTPELPAMDPAPGQAPDEPAEEVLPVYVIDLEQAPITGEWPRISTGDWILRRDDLWHEFVFAVDDLSLRTIDLADGAFYPVTTGLQALADGQAGMTDLFMTNSVQDGSLPQIRALAFNSSDAKPAPEPSAAVLACVAAGAVMQPRRRRA
jgi:hypothetical protein